MDEKLLLGKRIQEIRKARKLSQEACAELAGINSKYFGFIEQGRGNPTIEILQQCAKALKVDLADLFAYRWQSLSEAELKKKVKAITEKADRDQLQQILAIVKATEV